VLTGFMLERRGKHVPAAVAFALLSFKPQFLILPLLALLYLRSWRTAAWTAGLSVALILAGFALVGPEVAVNYVELNIDLLQDGPAPITTAWMYNWEGFLFALSGEAQELLSRLLSLATLLIAVSLVLGRRDLTATLAVAVTALAAPYVLFYDWTLLVASAALAAVVLTLPRERWLASALMFGVWCAIWATHDSLPIFGTQSGELPDGTVYWSTLALGMALVVIVAAFHRPARAGSDAKLPGGNSP
jgi:Glycosyltransferase family 87